MTCSVVKRLDGETTWKPVTADDNISPCNNLVDSFFSSVDIFLNDKRISTDNSFRYLSGHVGRLLTFNSAATNTFLATELGIPDIGSPDQVYPLVNLGFGKRKNIFQVVNGYTRVKKCFIYYIIFIY
jgi:hypothetical protein